jgi:hypothetical protein
MQKIHENENGQSTQTFAIESLAAELHKPIDEVRQTYEQQLARLTSGARIRDFVAVFAVRNTRKTLRDQGR